MPVGVMKFAECMRVAGVKQERRIKHSHRRVESPAERAVVDSVHWEEGVDTQPGIPVPPEAGPTWAIPTGPAANIDPRRVHARFGQVPRSQTVPAIELVFELPDLKPLGLRFSVGV